MNNKPLIEVQLYELLHEMSDRLPIDDFNHVFEFIKHREWGLAHETLCTQLYEYDTPITTEFYEKIASLGRLMEIDPSFWMPLKELIIDCKDNRDSLSK